jgi:FAD:protein FMN transferase
VLSAFPLLPASASAAAALVAARVRHAEPVMGTVVSFDVPAAAVADGSLESAVRWLHWVDRIFSPYRPDSDVSLLAAAEVTVDACAPEVAEVISACTAVRLSSGGYFTAAPSGVFDPSGYVKGWAVERAAALLAATGSSSHLVNGGGDVQCVGGRPRSGPAADAAASAEPWRVGVADPFHRGGLALVVEAADGAVATSGTAERGAHIIDPHRGAPASGLASLTIVGPSLALADAYATAAFAMGPDRARDWTESLPGYEAYAITADGDTWQTTGFAAHIATD